MDLNGTLSVDARWKTGKPAKVTAYPFPTSDGPEVVIEVWRTGGGTRGRVFLDLREARTLGAYLVELAKARGV